MNNNDNGGGLTKCKQTKTRKLDAPSLCDRIVLLEKQSLGVSNREWNRSSGVPWASPSLWF